MVSIKPSDLFVGVVDLFAILLPGSILAFISLEFAKDHVFGSILPEVQGSVQGWIAFVFASYLLGHVAFLLGTQLDAVYDNTYREWKRQGKRYRDTQTGQLERASDQLTPIVRTAKEKALRGFTDKTEVVRNVSTLRWADAYVRSKSSSATVEIDRLEADSKFFRSLVVALLIMSFTLVVQGKWLETASCLLCAVLAFFLYAEQRWKRTVRTYIHFIALQQEVKAKRPDEPFQIPAPLSSAQSEPLLNTEPPSHQTP